MIGWLKKATFLTLAVSGFFIVGSKGFVLLNNNQKNDLLKNPIEGSGLNEMESEQPQIISELPENLDDGDLFFEEISERREDFTPEKHDFLSDNLHEIKKRDADNFENLCLMQKSKFTCDLSDFVNVSHTTVTLANVEPFVPTTVSNDELSASSIFVLPGKAEVKQEKLIRLSVTGTLPRYDIQKRVYVSGDRKFEKILDLEIDKTWGVLTERNTEVVSGKEEISKSILENGTFYGTANRTEYLNGVSRIKKHDCKENGLVITGNETIHKVSNTNIESMSYHEIDDDGVEKYIKQYKTTANGTSHLVRIEQKNATLFVTTNIHTLYNGTMEETQWLAVYKNGIFNIYPRNMQTNITDSKVVTVVSINVEKNITTTESTRIETKSLKIKINDPSTDKCQLAIFRNSTITTDTFVVYVSNSENKTITEEKSWKTVQLVNETEKLCDQQIGMGFSKSFLTSGYSTAVISGNSKNENRRRTVLEVEKSEEKIGTSIDNELNEREDSFIIKESSSLKEFPL